MSLAGLLQEISPVFAGAFTVEQGHGLAIGSFTLQRNDDGFAANGASAKAAKSHKTEPSIFVEYGAKDWLTLFAQSSYVTNRISGTNTASFSGAGYTELGGRVRIVKDGPFVLSVQSSLRLPAHSQPGNSAQAGNYGLETDNRIMVARSFSLGDWPSYVDVNFGYRTRAGAPASEWRSDLSFGMRPVAHILLLVQSFNIISDGSGRSGYPRTSSSKLQISAVYDLNSSWSLQLGGYATIAGSNSNRELAAIGAIWRRF